MKSRKSIRILFTCVGRRVELMEAFRAAARKLRISLRVHAADANPLSPGLHLADRSHVVEPISSPHYIDTLVALAKKERINLLVPLIDSELLPLAAAADRFVEMGCLPLISSQRVVQLCRDKLATFQLLKDSGIDTPRTRSWKESLQENRRNFPFFLKPRAGSAAMGNYVIHNDDELRVLGRRVPDAVVQEFVDGVEYTLDVYAGLNGVPRCAVPRRRLEVRGGEVSKSIIVKDPAIMSLGLRVAKTLTECKGVITIQCIVANDRRIRVIEINPRFGGGAPLSIRAGADFPRWILQELLGATPRIRRGGFRNGVAMLRYDQSVFVPRARRMIKSSYDTPPTLPPPPATKRSVRAQVKRRAGTGGSMRPSQTGQEP